MRFGFNDMGFPHDDLEENFKLVSKAGYDGVEPTLTTDDVLGQSEELKRMADLAEQYDLEIPSVLTSEIWEYPLSSPDEETRERGVEVAIQTIEAGAALGVETMLVVPGNVTDDVPYDVAYENARESMHELAPIAGEHDVTLAVENVWNDFLLSPLEFASFVDDAAERGPVGAYFDVGNILRFGNPAQWIRILDHRIEKIHVKDYDTDIDNGSGFTYPVQGDVPWHDVADALDDVGYDGWITPEVSPYDTSPELMPSQVLESIQTVF